MLNETTDRSIEEHICDLARLALITNRLADHVRKSLRTCADTMPLVAAVHDMMEADLEAFFACVDDIDIAARGLRQAFYQREAA